MRYNELTLEDKKLFIRMFNAEGTREKNIKKIADKFKIKKSTIYTFHQNIMGDLYPLGISVEDLIYNEDGVLKENEILSKENMRLRKSLTRQSDNNTALRKEYRDDARRDNILDRITSIFELHLEKINLELPEVVITNHINDDNKILEDGLCVLFSDEHFGEIVDDSVTPFNNYNYNIIEKRLFKVVEEVIRYKKQSKTLNVFQLLDVLKGIIHNGKFTSEGGLTTSMIKVVEIYSKIYTHLSLHYDNINIVVTNSNHDRITDDPASNNKWDSYGIMLMKFVDMVLKSKNINNVNFSYTNHDYQLVSINGSKVIAFHGDSLRTYKPFNDTEVSKLQDICLGMFKELYTHAVSGHIHKHYSCDNFYGGKNITNSSLVGNTEYGTSNGYRSINPSQTIFFIEEDGKIKDVTTIDLSDII